MDNFLINNKYKISKESKNRETHLANAKIHWKH